MYLVPSYCSAMENLISYPFLHTVNKMQKINYSTVKNRLARRPHKLFEPHRIDFNAIYLFTAGHGIHTVDFRELEVKPGYILFVTKGQVHHFDPNENYDAHSVIFTDDFFNISAAHLHYFQQSLLLGDPLMIPYFDVGENYEILCSYFNNIRDELMQQPDRQQHDILNNCLHNIMLIAERTYATTIENPHFSQARKLVAAFKGLANVHVHEHWNIKRYADELHVHHRTLQYAFLKIEGKTPKQWLSELLILQSKRYLIHEDPRVTEIAFKLGFKEVTNFVKFFRKHVGKSPMEFKHSI